MTKSLIIEFDAEDESLLLAFFKKLSIKFRQTETPNEISEEDFFVQNMLQKKYVETGEWKSMDDDERQDAALAEMMAYEQQHPDYKVMNVDESATFLANLKKQLYANSTD
jgi:hypothetical protein